MKVSLAHVISVLTVLGIASTFIIKYGSLPQAVAQVQEKIDQYQEDISELKAEQKYVRERSDDIYELLKQKIIT